MTHLIIQPTLVCIGKYFICGCNLQRMHRGSVPNPLAHFWWTTCKILQWSHLAKLLLSFVDIVGIAVWVPFPANESMNPGDVSYNWCKLEMGVTL